MTPTPENAERSVRELLSEITLNEDCLHHSSDAPLETIRHRLGRHDRARLRARESLRDSRSATMKSRQKTSRRSDRLTALVARKCP